MTFPLMPVVTSVSSAPVAAYSDYYFGRPTTLTSLGADNPDRVVVLAISSGSLTSGTVSIGGVSQTVYYPQSSGTVLTSGTSYTQFVVARVPTGTSVSASISMGSVCMWYTITGLDSIIPFAGISAAGNPASGSVTMQENSVIIANLYADNDNNSFTWSSPMVRTVNDTSLGPSRGASSAFRQNTTSGAYTVSVSYGSGSLYMGAIILR